MVEIVAYETVAGEERSNDQLKKLEQRVIAGEASYRAFSERVSATLARESQADHEAKQTKAKETSRRTKLSDDLKAVEAEYGQ